MLDILLVIPPFESKYRLYHQEGLGVGYLVAVLRKYDFNVEILHADLYGMSIKDTIEILYEKPARIVGFSIIQEVFENSIVLIKKLKQKFPQTHVTCGGFYPTLAFEEVFFEAPEVDSIVMGEGESTFLELSQCIIDQKDWQSVHGIIFKKDNQLVKNPLRKLDTNLDSIPFPVRDHLPQVLKKGGNSYVISSRGCLSNCSFCSVRSFYKTIPGVKWRPRRPSNIVDEMESLVDQFKVNFIGIQDDNVFGYGKNRQRIIDIANELKLRKLNLRFSISCRVDSVDKKLFKYLKGAGLAMVFLGVESMNQDVLGIFNKQTTVEANKRALKILDELKIFSYPHMIMFNPYSELNQIKTDLAFIKERVTKGYGPFFNMAASAVALQIDQGTPMYRLLKGEKWVTKIRHSHHYQIANRKAELLRRLFKYGLSLVAPLYAELSRTGRKSIGLWNRLNMIHIQFLEGLIASVEKNLTPEKELMEICNTYIGQLDKFHSILNRHHNFSLKLANPKPELLLNQKHGGESLYSPLNDFIFKTSKGLFDDIKHCAQI
jgi:radical SAM superfamily enzyme YgiQ (UPF0313 family)